MKLSSQELGSIRLTTERRGQGTIKYVGEASWDSATKPCHKKLELRTCAHVSSGHFRVWVGFTSESNSEAIARDVCGRSCGWW